MHNNDEIESIPCPVCKVCGLRGVPVYQGLKDHLFHSPGVWNLYHCPSEECGLMWLNPMPLEDDIHKAYRSYYTHDKSGHDNNRLKECITNIEKQLLKFLLRLTPIYRERKEFNQMYLSRIKPGRLLEVGCGSGSRLTQFAILGWSVEGQEVDAASAAIAERRGLKIHLGTLDNLNLPDGSYEAIVMNHVIEHVHDPFKLLKECRRLLSPNGILIAVTPNIHSYGHRIFKSYWRGLEPPRHIILYSQNSLRHLAQIAGFVNPTTWTTSANAHHFALDTLNIISKSKNLESLTKIFNNVFSKLFLIISRVVHIFNKDSGEECVLMLRKSE